MGVVKPYLRPGNVSSLPLQDVTLLTMVLCR